MFSQTFFLACTRRRQWNNYLGRHYFPSCPTCPWQEPMMEISARILKQTRHQKWWVKAPHLLFQAVTLVVTQHLCDSLVPYFVAVIWVFHPTCDFQVTSHLRQNLGFHILELHSLLRLVQGWDQLPVSTVVPSLCRLPRRWAWDRALTSARGRTAVSAMTNQRTVTWNTMKTKSWLEGWWEIVTSTPSLKKRRRQTLR